MTDTWTDMAPKRDQYGRPLIVPMGGTKALPHTRATTLAKALDDQSSLIDWQGRMVAKGLALRPDLLAIVASHDLDDKKALNEACRSAKEAAEASAAANTGTALHRFCENVDRDPTYVVAEQWRADVDAYRQCLEVNGVEILPEWIEEMVVCSELTVAGSPDRFVRWDGRTVVFDIKTSQSLRYGALAWATQLACYAHSDSRYDWATNTHQAMPDDLDQAVGLILWLPSGHATAELHLIDLTLGWEAARTAHQVRDWRKAKPLIKVEAQGSLRLAADGKPAPKRIDPVDKPRWSVDEGVDNSHRVDDLRVGVARYVTPDLVPTWKRWLQEGDDTKRPFRFTDNPSERRFAVIRAGVRMLALTGGEDPHARILLGEVLGEEVQPGVFTGTVLGSLGIAEANDLARICDEITNKKDET